MKKFTEEEKQRITELVNQGVSHNQIARELNRAFSSISFFINSKIKKFNDKNISITFLSYEEKKQIADFYQKGFLIKEIAEKLNRGRNTITRFLKSHDFVKNHSNIPDIQNNNEDKIKKIEEDLEILKMHVEIILETMEKKNESNND